jgi:transcriptional regulator with XRE-family HTH domain
MPTQNRRIATYLPKELDEKFKVFKLERGIKGDSNALLTVLSEFLGVTESIVPLMNTQYEELSQRFYGFQSELTALESRLFSRLKSELLAELPTAPLLAASDSVIGPSQSADRSVEFGSEDLTRLTGKELSLRLGISSDTANRWRPGKDREKFPEKLLRDTRKKDPDGIGWSYLPEVDKFQSEKPLPALSLSELPVFSSFDPVEDF